MLATSAVDGRSDGIGFRREWTTFASRPEQTSDDNGAYRPFTMRLARRSGFSLSNGGLCREQKAKKSHSLLKTECKGNAKAHLSASKWYRTQPSDHTSAFSEYS